MKVIFCDNSWQKKWDEFVKNNSLDFGLLQSWGWGEFQQELGRKIFRLAVVEGEGDIRESRFQAVAQIIKMPLKLGKSYFYIPRGPIVSAIAETSLKFKVQSLKLLNILFLEIKKLAKKEEAIFLRFEPVLRPPLNPPLIKGGKLRDSPLIKKEKIISVGQVQPKKTLILDLTKSENELLAQMKPKTRYNIKVAQKHNIEIIILDPISASWRISPLRQGGEDDIFQDFWQLLDKTAKRQEIKPHPKEYYQKMLGVFSPEGIIKLIVAKYRDKVIAANLVAFFGDWAVYLHGASDYDFRDKMAPYLLHWETIKTAKKQGKKFYDFWGVDEKKWPGITRFKISFAPEQKITEYIGAWDEVYSWMWYNGYRLFKIVTCNR